MFIRVLPGCPSLLQEPEVFTSLKIVTFAELQDDVGPATLLDCGRVDDGRAHVWVSPDWLRASGPQRPDWRQGLAAMLAYAAQKGWLDVEGRVRAHIEFVPGA